ncbi:hypothetical protein KQX54_006094 [Cotesia glomerata]|uniref:Uncharacterized protein n=1 Tax=Cotesia glomerata TaxID=32391 RepID=A0AAV7HPD8_COTGL|nr:hypothetical protein KQX54_006094 [Cotesia glomerata]
MKIRKRKGARNEIGRKGACSLTPIERKKATITIHSTEKGTFEIAYGRYWQLPDRSIKQKLAFPFPWALVSRLLTRLNEQSVFGNRMTENVPFLWHFFHPLPRYVL